MTKADWISSIQFRNEVHRIVEEIVMVAQMRNREMSKKYCYNCEFIRKPAGAMYIPHPLSICLNPLLMKRNFVTGDKECQICKILNNNGTCQHHEQKEKHHELEKQITENNK